MKGKGEAQPERDCHVEGLVAQSGMASKKDWKIPVWLVCVHDEV